MWGWRVDTQESTVGVLVRIHDGCGCRFRPVKEKDRIGEGGDTTV